MVNRSSCQTQRKKSRQQSRHQALKKKRKGASSVFFQSLSRYRHSFAIPHCCHAFCFAVSVISPACFFVRFADLGRTSLRQQSVHRRLIVKAAAWAPSLQPVFFIFSCFAHSFIRNKKNVLHSNAQRTLLNCASHIVLKVVRFPANGTATPCLAKNS